MKLKKILITLATITAAFLALGTCANAANGDIAGTLYTTDILTQIDGMDIPSYNIDGQTLIAVEDLRNFGYTVAYDDSIRTLIATYNHESHKPGMGQISRGTVGGTAGYYYESDITVIVNGNYIQAYSLDGTMLVIAEELGQSDYFAACSYSDSERLLSLYTDYDGKMDYSQAEQYVIDNFRQGKNDKNDLVRYDTDTCTIFYGTLTGGPLHSYRSIYAYIVYKNGVYFNLDNIILNASGLKADYIPNFELFRTDYFIDFGVNVLGTALCYTQIVTEFVETGKEYDEANGGVMVSYMSENTYNVQHQLDFTTILITENSDGYQSGGGTPIE